VLRERPGTSALAAKDEPRRDLGDFFTTAASHSPYCQVKGGVNMTLSRKMFWIGGGLVALAVLIVVLVVVYGGGGSGGGY
jgi:hypothetical protein